MGRNLSSSSVPRGGEGYVRVQKGLLQEQSQVSGDVANKINHTLQRWKQRLTLENPRLVERYLKSELHVILHLRVRKVGEQDSSLTDLGEFALHCEKHFGDVDIMAHLPTQIFKGTQERIELVAPVLRNDGEQQSVLVGDAQSVQFPKDFAFTSTVRFDKVDRIYAILPKSLYFPSDSDTYFVELSAMGKKEEPGLNPGFPLNSK